MDATPLHARNSTGDKLQSYISSPRTMLGLPAELRLEIFDTLFRSTTLSTSRGVVKGKEPETCASPFYGDGLEDSTQVTISESRKRRLSAVPQLPEKLNLVCRTFNNEIGDSWHSKVTYYFPSSVAFIDVLSQWPTEKVQKLKHVHVDATPIPLNHYPDVGYYTTHFMPAALPIFPGLQLDTLTVQNIWLQPNGEEVDPWCLGATRYDVFELLASSGWKEFRYLSGVLGFTPKELRELDQKLADMKIERGEHDFEYHIGRNRPRLSGLVTHHPDGTTTEHDSPEDKAEVAQWYKDHPDEPKSPLPENKEYEVQLWAKRGAKANYVQDGSGLEEVIKGLLNHMSWVELRKSDEYLVDDGYDDAEAHL